MATASFQPRTQALQRPAPGWSGGVPEWVWVLTLAGLTLLYCLTFFNRFAGLRSGNGEFFTGLAFLHGQFPYRDYFSATPPLNTFKSALLLRWFGPLLLVSRAGGALERVALAVLLYRWLRMLFPAGASFFASLVTIVVSSGDRSDPLASYNHDAILWAMLSAFVAAQVLREPGRPRLAWGMVAGLAAGLCLLTKQTVGLGAVIVVPGVVLLLLLRRGLGRAGAVWTGSFAAGVLLPLIGFFMWLRGLGISSVFIEMCFKRGPAAKAGHLTDLLVREAMVARGNLVWVALALAALGLGARALLRSRAAEDGSPDGHPDRYPDRYPDGYPDGLPYSLLAGLGAVILASGVALAFTSLPALYDFSKASIYFTLAGISALLLYLLGALVRRPLTAREEQFTLFAACSFCVAGLLSLSWPAFEAMALPGLGLLLAGVLDGTRKRGRQFALLVLCAMMFLAIREKLDLPFAFGGLGDLPVRAQNRASTLPALAGMRLAGQTDAFLEGVQRAVEDHARAGETIFTYPEMGLIYSLTGRTYPTLSGSHNVDVIKDDFAREEAGRLLTARPAVLITFTLTPAEIAEEDRTWRGGKPSGQHILAAAVAQLAAGYRLEGTYELGPEGRRVGLYVRPRTVDSREDVSLSGSHRLSLSSRAAY